MVTLIIENKYKLHKYSYRASLSYFSMKNKLVLCNKTPSKSFDINHSA